MFYKAELRGYNREMSEIPTAASETSPAEPSEVMHIVDFTDREDYLVRIDPIELVNEDAEAFLLGTLSHPGENYSPSAKLAERIHNLLGNSVRNNLTPKDVEWRKRMMAIMVDLEAYHPDEFDFLISTDPVLRELHAAFKETGGKAAELREQRNALELLKEFRAGLVIHESYDQTSNKKWHRLIHRLVGDQEI
jgi:hypothetical protein